VRPSVFPFHLQRVFNIRCLFVTFACHCRRRSVIITIIIIIVVIYFHSYKNGYETKWQFQKKKKCILLKAASKSTTYKWMISGVLLLFFFNLGTIVTQMSRFTTIILVQKIGNVYLLWQKTTTYRVYSCSVCQILYARGEWWIFFFRFLILSRIKTFRKVDLNRWYTIYIYLYIYCKIYIVYNVILLLYNLREFVWKQNRVLFECTYSFCTPTSAGPDFKTINETRDIAIMSDEFIETITTIYEYTIAGIVSKHLTVKWYCLLIVL